MILGVVPVDTPPPIAEMQLIIQLSINVKLNFGLIVGCHSDLKGLQMRLLLEQRCLSGPCRDGEETPVTLHCFFMTSGAVSGSSRHFVSNTRSCFVLYENLEDKRTKSSTQTLE
ncbi:hypothetical protein AMELA_G00112410 [Ameiurus melas]|uniref:Uncharacterized protein n=1 Tax=Ameiurus melas TaxID=219545 RepID=A0A7J6AQE1_AMEME|nr:hypothetical protein AMELA_G00112410 [Ameiurus melas]